MTKFKPAYLSLIENRTLQAKVTEAYQRLGECNICAHHCKVNRLEGVLGICRTGDRAQVSSYGPHFGEEDPLRGQRGSGTIFFTRCNLRCQYCQNSDISQSDSGYEVDSGELATMMLDLQSKGCHNINFVSPSHIVPQILAGVLIAAKAGLQLPLVYNTGGYDSLESLELLAGVIDIYMPDMKYASPQIAQHYSKIRDYPRHNQAAVKEMHRQVGDLQMDDQGVATSGLLVRHLVLPNGLAGTDKIVTFLAEEISKNTYINIMDQYRPMFNAQRHPKLRRPLKKREYRQTVQLAKDAGLHRLDER